MFSSKNCWSFSLCPSSNPSRRMTASPSVSSPWKQLGDFEGDELVSIAFIVAVSTEFH